MKQFVISEEVAQALLNHLGNQPYVVAQPLVEQLQKGLKPYEEPAPASEEPKKEAE
jgi:hypothetical protein